MRNLIYAFAVIAEQDDMTRAGIASRAPESPQARMSPSERAAYAKEHAPMPTGPS